MAQYAGSCRFVVNKALSLNKERYSRFPGLPTPRITYHDTAGLLKLWKQSDEYGFLSDTHSQVLQQALMDLDRGYHNFFAGRAEEPTYRKKFVNDAFRFPQAATISPSSKKHGGFAIIGNHIKLPKIGWVRFWKSQEIEGTPKTLTISRDGDHWYASIQVEMEVDQPRHPSQSAVGIDLGIAQFATLSDGTVHEPLHSFRRHEAQLVKEQRKLSAKVPFSNNWRKQKRNVNRIHAKIADSRRDYLQKTSTEISKSHAIIVVEDLKVANMSKSARGTIEQPGRHVAQKSGLNKSILDQGWGRFRTMLAYKQEWRGGLLIAVQSQYTSQTCSECGYIDKASRPTQALFSCVHCGHAANADVNAAQNILASGLGERLNACEIGSTVFQESHALYPWE